MPVMTERDEAEKNNKHEDREDEENIEEKISNGHQDSDKSSFAPVTRCCRIHFPTPEMHAAWLGFAASPILKKSTLYTDILVLILELPAVVNMASRVTVENWESHGCSMNDTMILVTGIVSFLIRILFYLFVLGPADLFRLDPDSRIYWFPKIATLCLGCSMVFLQILLSGIFDCVFMDYDTLSRNAWRAICLNGTMDVSANQTCMLAGGSIGKGNENSNFTLNWNGAFLHLSPNMP